MTTYPLMIAALNAVRTDPVPVNVLIAARALDILDPGNLDVSASGLPTYRGSLVAGMTSVTAVLGAPGVACRDAAAGDTGLTIAAPITGPLASDFNASDVSVYTGPGQAAAIAAVSSLLSVAMNSGLLTTNEVQRIGAVLSVGGWCAPTAKGTEGKRFASNPAVQAQWDQLALPFDNARTAYIQGQYEQAAAAAASSAEYAALMDAIYNAAQTVSQAPAIIVNAAAAGVADAVTKNVSALTGKTLLVVGVVGLGLLAVFIGPRFFVKAVT